MKYLIVFLVSITTIGMLTTVIAQETDSECNAEAVAEWMIQRQIGRNRLQPLINGEVNMTLIEALLLVQAVRRDLEDLPRPDCANELHGLTIFFYDALIDFYTFQLAGNSDSAESIINPRIQHYFDSVDLIYTSLETVAAVDVMATAGAVEPIATLALTQAPAETIAFSGETGGTVLGPVDIPTGVYRMTLTGGPNLTATLEQINGSCIGTFSYVDGDGGSTELIFRSQNCRALIEISASRKVGPLNLNLLNNIGL